MLSIQIKVLFFAFAFLFKVIFYGFYHGKSPFFTTCFGGI